MTEDLVGKALNALRQKNFIAAREAITAFAAENTLEFQHYLIKGLSEIALADWPAAYETFIEATSLFPHQPQLWLNRGIAEENLGHIEDAASSFEESLALKNDQPDIYGNLSNIYRKQGRFAEAEAMAHRAFELGAPKAQALNSLALALGKQGKFEAAEKNFQDAHQLEPSNPHMLANLANLAIDRLDLNAAWPFFAAARMASDMPAIQRDEGMAHLLAGDYAQGWRLYEARLDLPNALRLRPTCPRYRYEPVAGKKILLIAEQGFGDTIMFCRYGKMLADAGAEIIWAVQPALKRLLAGQVPGLVLEENEALPQTDYYLPLLSLPLATSKLSPADAPRAPYLCAPDEPKILNAAAERKIGLVWVGSRTHERDHERSLSPEALAPLLEKIQAKFYAPFVGHDLNEDGAKLITPLDNLITDFADTAALLKQLDCLVTVDTATAHLAGALDVKTYLMLQYSPDWRWGTYGDTTPWYPSVTLLRQPHYGDWDSVVNQVVEKLLP